MSSPDRKRKKTKRKPSPLEQSPNPSLALLPHDLVVSCLARVSRLYYPTLSFVSKSFSSLLASSQLYETRSSLGRTESCLYVCVRFPDEPKFRWFTLCRRPDRTLTTSDAKKKKKKSSGYVLAKIPTPHSGPAHDWPGLVTIGSNIYNIGGPIDSERDSHGRGYPSSSVLILDSRSNTWREGPSMLVRRMYPHASVLDGKIYVAGGWENCSCPSAWMEVFDPKTETWEFVSNPGAEICAEICAVDYIRNSAGVDGKVYIFGNINALAYEPREGRWERVMYVDWYSHSYSVIDNVLYSYTHEKCFKWYDTKAGLWRILKGLKGLPKIPRHCARLADYGGKMAVVWERLVAKKEKMILCAVIALERRNNEEIWGKVEWSDTVLTVPKSCLLEYAVATTV